MKTRVQTLSIALVLLLTAATGAAQVITRVSEATAGGAGNGDSRLMVSRWAINSDGRYVAFESDATDLVADDTNGVTDVFVRDVELGTTTRVSVDVNGEDADGPSEDPSISADGRYVAFRSAASDLVEGDGNGVGDVFVRDLHRGATIRISVDTEGGDADGESNTQSISADGRVVAFSSHATDLINGDGNGVADVFVRDLDLGETLRVSVDPAGGDGEANSWGPAISADGRYVAFTSVAGNLVANDTGFRDIFVRDLEAQQTIWVSVGRDGNSPNEGSIGPSLSEHGRFVAFRSRASDLVDGDTNGQDDIFVRDLMTGFTSRVNVSSSGAQTVDAGSWFASISADGRFVVFSTDAENLTPDDANGWGDVFSHDRATGTTTLLSVSAAGVQGDDGFSRWGVTTPDGRFMVFESTASNLVDGDNNGVMDVFLAGGPAVVPNNVRICPGAASAPGVGTAFWVTDVRLFNPDPHDSITVWLSALLRDADNTGAVELPVTLSARGGLALDDILTTFFGLANTTAAIRMRSEAPFFATSRTSNVGGDTGTFGSFIPGFAPEAALDRGILLHVINQPGLPGFRSNVGFANPGLHPVAVTVEVFDADDRALLGSRGLDLAPRTFSQINDVFKFIGQQSRETPNATVEFRAGAPILAYASVIDNESGDSIFVVPSADQGTPLP